jgi:hypothetical protein
MRLGDPVIGNRGHRNAEIDGENALRNEGAVIEDLDVENVLFYDCLPLATG